MTHNSCKKHKGMKVTYDPQKYRRCLLCVKGEHIQLLLSATRGILEYVALAAESMDLIFKNAPEEQQVEVQSKKRETSKKVFKDLKEANELMYLCLAASAENLERTG